ncbi:MAG: hypothetical protein AAGM67_15365, partial [Bacteroidota bacterium]
WGNVFVNGLYREATNFINLNLNSPTEKGYLGRLQADGTFAWVGDVDSFLFASAMVADGYGNLHLLGSSLDNVYRKQIWMRYDTLGNPLGYHQLDGCRIHDAEVDDHGHVIIVGVMDNDLEIDGTVVLTNPNPSPANAMIAGFVLKYDPFNDTFLWGQVIYSDNSGAGIANANSVSIDGQGNTFVSGRFRHDTVRIGNIATAFNSLGPSWQSNSFLAALDVNGSPQWVVSGASINFGEIAANDNGEVYCSGTASGFNTTPPGLVVLMDTTFTVPSNQNQPFLLKVDATGQRIGLHLESATTSISNSAITLNPVGEPILVNQVYSDITIMGNLLSANNISSIYVQKFDADLNPEWAKFGQGGSVAPNTNWGVSGANVVADPFGNY